MQALGTIEVVGLVAGVEAADVACKAADVQLVGYELAKGGGYVTVKVLGQVGAVTAAIDAAAVAATRLTRVVSKLVIPRPSDQIAALVANSATVGYTPSPTTPPPAPATPDAPTPQPSAAAPAADVSPAATEPSVFPAPEPVVAPAPALADPATHTTTRRKHP